MAIERIQQAFQKEGEGRFFLLFGKGIDDAFISPRLQELNIESALLHYLKQGGIERVAFVAPHKPVFFLDQISREMTRPDGSLYHEAQAEELAAVDEMQVLGEGPLGKKILIKTLPPPESGWNGNAMGDVHALRILDAIMHDTQSRPSAVVMVQAESWMDYFDDRRTLAGVIGEWTRLPVYNHNICLFLFSVDSSEALEQIAARIPIPELRSLIQREDRAASNGSLIHISTPDKIEMIRLMQYASQLYQIPVEKEDVDLLAGWMEAENMRARQWLARFSEVPGINQEIARRSGWFSANRGEKKTIEERLNALVGLDIIKERIYELSAWISLQMRKREISVSQGEAPMLHLIFTGNPGTGKTTVARLIGEIFHDLGLLKRGHLIEVKASDLVAEYVGGTAVKTNQVIDRSMDGVLFIDEAYSLTEAGRGGYGQEAIEVLLKRMEDDRQRLVVIAAGYPDKMDHFLRSNPGLPRRFPVENQLDFPDYSPEELWQILERMLANRDIPLDPETSTGLQEMVTAMVENRDETFGNAGEMRSLAESLDRRRAYRIVKNNLPDDIPLLLSDVTEQYRAFLRVKQFDLGTIMIGLDHLVGIQPAKEYLHTLATRLQLDTLRRQQNPDVQYSSPMQHIVFTGSPGTGKTTVARMVGSIYQAMGLLRRGHCVEVSRADLVAGYVGQTALKTREKIKEALDGVLFVDEAYALDRGGPMDFGREAVDTLVKAMEDFRGRLVVIVAGYPDEIEQFIQGNPGLKSRLASVVEFPDFTPGELGEILCRQAQREGYILPGEVLKKASDYLFLMAQEDGRHFGNARSVGVVYEQMKARLAERKMQQIDSLGSDPSSQPEDLSTFTIEDVPQRKHRRRKKPPLNAQPYPEG